MTHPDTPRPPMSETVKPLTKEWLADQRKLAERNPNGYLMIGQDVLSVLEALEKAERDLAQLRKAAANFIEAVGAEVSGPSQKALAALIAPPTTGSAP